MPFNEEEQDLDELKPKTGLGKVSSQKSIFDSVPKKPSQSEFEAKVKNIQEKSTGYKSRASELSLKFKKILSDKTLVQNKNVFSVELETELLSDMVKLAVEVNNDPNEQEGMGSLMWIILLLKTTISQRDRINDLEYLVYQMDKKLNNIKLSENKINYTP